MSIPGDSVTFDCVVTGVPRPRVQWTFNGRAVSEGAGCQLYSDGDRYALTVPYVNDRDAGRFAVTAENDSGRATCSALLMVGPLPDQYGLGQQTSGNELIPAKMPKLGPVPPATAPTTVISTMPEMSPREDVPLGKSRPLAAGQPSQPIDTALLPVPPRLVEPLHDIVATEGIRVEFEGLVAGNPEPAIKV